VTGQPDVYLARHGATDWSVTGRHTGRTELPLNDQGRQEGVRLAEMLGGRPFSLVLVSPSSRARETCELAGFADTAERTDDLLEWDYGDYEGVTTAEIRQHTPGWTVWKGPTPNGETLAEVGERADRVIDRVLSSPGDVVLFAHGHILRVLTARWCQLAPEEGRRFPLATASLSILGWEHDDRGVRLWNARPGSPRSTASEVPS
jgi:broad specificity phosphatase PhoE